jgi:hypothetical protein
MERARERFDPGLRAHLLSANSLTHGPIRKKEERMARTRKNFYRKSSKRKTPPRTFKATCAQCGKEVLMEVAPSGNGLICFDCYKKK